MREPLLALVALSVAVTACPGPGADGSGDTSQARRADSPATALGGRAPGAGGSPPATSSRADGAEPGTIPATPTPAVTSESSIATMRTRLQQLGAGSVENLQRSVPEHSKALGDLLTTMRVEVQALTTTAKDSWLASADSAEDDLDRLALARGEELRTAFRQHQDRVLRLLGQFRVLVPSRPGA